jgi:hypothetical protein
MNRNHAIQPVKLKLFGLITMTRVTYIVIQKCVFVILISVGMLLSSIALHSRAIVEFLILELGLIAGNQREWVQGLEILAWCLVGLTVIIAVGEVCETFFVLRKFKAKQQQLAISSEDETPSL